jgi:hypothetical protein
MMDPYRNAESDLEDALEYGRETFEAWPRHGDPCFVMKRVTWSLKKILGYDDYSSWGEWRTGELQSLDDLALRDELVHFRGNAWAALAFKWIRQDGVPAIVIIDSNKYGVGIADGRGRVSLGVGLLLPRLSVVLLTDCP